MVTPTSSLRFFPPVTNYGDYLFCAETNNFCGYYDRVLVPYAIDPTAAAVPADGTQLIYTKVQEGVTTAFL